MNDGVVGMVSASCIMMSCIWTSIVGARLQDALATDHHAYLAGRSRVKRKVPAITTRAGIG